MATPRNVRFLKSLKKGDKVYIANGLILNCLCVVTKPYDEIYQAIKVQDIKRPKCVRNTDFWFPCCEPKNCTIDLYVSKKKEVL